MLVAEGVGSTTRELVFPGENDPRWYNAPGGRSVFLRPDRYGTTRAVLTLKHEVRATSDLSDEEAKA